MWFWESPFRKVYCFFFGHIEERYDGYNRIYYTCARCWKQLRSETIPGVEPIWAKHHEN